jgi:hypothetical protein
MYQVSVVGADYEGRVWKEYMGGREPRWKTKVGVEVFYVEQDFQSNVNGVVSTSCAV